MFTRKRKIEELFDSFPFFSSEFQSFPFFSSEFQSESFSQGYSMSTIFNRIVFGNEQKLIILAFK